MDNNQLMHEGHEVIGDDYCSGYMDSFGKWNNGFHCPPQDNGSPVFCCGTESVRYCCIRPKTPVSPPVSQMTLLLSMTFAVAVTVAVVVMISCFHCACCFLYKKRQPATASGSFYQMHCPSNASGVANMYSISGMTTPAETPRSISRASSARSRLTATDSSDLTELYRTSDSSRVYLASLPDSRPDSLAYSDQTSSTATDTTVREYSTSLGRSRFSRIRLPYLPYEPPPPYSAPNSTLVAVRTSTHGVSSNGNQSSGIMGSRPNSNNSTATSGDSTQMRTFAHLSATNELESGASQNSSLGASARLSAMRLNQQLNSLATLRQGYTNQINNIDVFLDDYEFSRQEMPQPMTLISPSVFSQRDPTNTAQLSTHGHRFDDNRIYTATKF